MLKQSNNWFFYQRVYFPPKMQNIIIWCFECTFWSLFVWATILDWNYYKKYKFLTFFESVIFTKHISESSRDNLSVVVLLPDLKKAINDSQFAPQNHFSFHHFCTRIKLSNVQRILSCLTFLQQKLVQNTLQLVNWFWRNKIFH